MDWLIAANLLLLFKDIFFLPYSHLVLGSHKTMEVESSAALGIKHIDFSLILTKSSSSYGREEIIQIIKSMKVTK